MVSGMPGDSGHPVQNLVEVVHKNEKEHVINLNLVVGPAMVQPLKPKVAIYK